MSLKIDLSELQEGPVELAGSVALSELGIGSLDSMLHVDRQAEYYLEVSLLDGKLIARGVVELQLECDCVSCLKRFPFHVRLDPWEMETLLASPETEGNIQGSADLTPSLREDIFLALPQHPRCRPDCDGLKSVSEKAPQTGASAAAWAELDRLKLE
ncbi:MAG: hypothetical protein EXS24_02390 [Pedosphaera sp.]|nr:hypothetical protein [Pedosphaera sp.]